MCDFDESKEVEFTTDYHNRCGHCHKKIGQDSYCRYCGTKRGDGEFKPYQNIMQCIYGPRPVKRIHKCSKCGNSYSVTLMVDNEKYCPLCGGKTVMIE